MRILLALKVLTIFLFAAVFPSSAQVTELRVGVITALSGNWASMGDMTLKGIELAAERVKKDGGPTITFQIQDSHEDSSGAAAVTAYRALQVQGINLFIGPNGTPGGLALAPLVANDKTLFISPSVAVEAFHLAGDTIFNSQGAFETASRKLAEVAYASGARRVGIFASQQPYESRQADAFAFEFEKLGGAIAVRVDPLPDQPSVRSEATRIMSAQPDAVFFAVYNQLSGAARELKQLGFQGRKYAPLVDHSRLEGASGGLDGLVFTKLGQTEESFSSRFKSKYNRAPDYPAEYAYDAVMALASAAKSAQSASPETMAKALLDVQFDGASGPFRFDGQGCVLRSPRLWKVDADKFVVASETKGANN